MSKENKIAIIDYGMGNLNSIVKKLTRLGAECFITFNPEEIKGAQKIILPGVGHFGKAMQKLSELGLIETLTDEARIKKKPILGICLGMQLMAKRSDEGNCDGLGWFNAEVIKIEVQNRLKYKVPHTGWNQIAISKPSKLMNDIPDFSEFYFVHSYHFKAMDLDDVLNESHYESKIVSAIERDNIFGVQYHPEKSHDVGELLLKNFIKL